MIRDQLATAEIRVKLRPAQWPQVYDELDTMIEAASLELDPRVRGGLLQACFARLRDEPVYFPLVVPDDLFLMNEDLIWQPEAAAASGC